MQNTSATLTTITTCRRKRQLSGVTTRARRQLRNGPGLVVMRNFGAVSAAMARVVTPDGAAPFIYPSAHLTVGPSPAGKPAAPSTYSSLTSQ